MDVLLYGKPSGKPPKDILMLSSSSSRERPGSPIADVDQNVVKKGCVGGSLNMSKCQSEKEVVGSQPKATYASMVAGMVRDSNYRDNDHGIQSKEIVVLDDDYVID
ncbi:hypothetical protein V6N13_097615 [Hibiscus sabdariffa]|uniref:Uncharacterized protein n=1 Tax=Hibiscus sabdariffa TaxID=183260 RepID=A0ABR2BUW0_9ROSI